MSVIRDLMKVWRTFVIILVPVIASPILTIDGSREMACLYGVVIMAAFWVTEALPLAVTALLPVVLFPLLGVLPSREVTSSYIKDATIFSFCCLVFAVCIERWNLHKRIALRTLLLMGSSPKWLMLGFMLPTWFLSMWVNNTSATAMMIPVVMAVLHQLHEIEVSRMAAGTDTEKGVALKERDNKGELDQEKESKEMSDEEMSYPSESYKHLCKGLSLCICYSATVGGTGSITGSSTNLIMQGQADAIFGAYGLESGVNFLTWIMCCLPSSVICLFVAWLWLVLHFFGVKELLKCGCGDQEKTKATRKVVLTHLKNLGPLTFAEKAVMGHFVVLVVLWLSMKIPGEIGWSYIFKSGYVHNSTPGILVVVSLFIFPSERPQVFCFFSKEKDSGEIKPRSVPSLLDWKTVHLQFPWGTWCLLGGGYALANVCQKSGLSLWIGSRLSVFSSMEPWVMVLLLSLAISFMTEVTSNAATASIIGPILAELAITLHMNPLYLLYPMVLACSLAFILPVATPPNAIVFATGHVKVKDMAKAGVVLNFLCVIIINVAINTWINAMQHLDTLPLEIVNRLNQSMSSQETVISIMNTTQSSVN